MIEQLAGLNRAQRRAMLRQLERDNLLYPMHLVKIPYSEWPGYREGWLRPIAMFRSRHFCVQVFDEGAVIRLSVNRTSVDERTLRWREDISWDDLQRLKGEAGYAHREAVEIYPPAGDEVNVANMRHLWVLHARLPFSWARKLNGRTHDEYPEVE